MKTKGLVLISIFLLLGAGIAILMSCNNQSGFTGSRVKNPDAYILDIEKMNGTDMHTLELNRGDSLRIRFETEKGSLHMEIKAPDGTSVYSGNGSEATDFTVYILEGGVYTVVVEARQARGNINIRVAGAEE